MQQIIIVLAFLVSSMAFGQESSVTKKKFTSKLTVSVMNVYKDTGNVKFALYNKVSFMAEPLQSKMAAIKMGISTVVFEDIQPGEYAVLCFHDVNNNGRMDFDEGGMPIESYGSSNNPMLMGPPQFESSKFKMEEIDKTLEIKF